MNAPIALDLRNSRLYFRSLMLAASEAALLATMFVLAWQRNWPVELPGFDYASVRLTHTLPTVCLVEVFASVAVIICLSAGWPHRDRLTNGAGRLFAWVLVLLPFTAALSTTWSLHPGLAAVQSVHMGLWVGFALVLAFCVAGDRRRTADRASTSRTTWRFR